MELESSPQTSLEETEDEVEISDSSVVSSPPDSEASDNDDELSDSLLPKIEICAENREVVSKRELSWEIVQQIRSELKRGLFIIDCLQSKDEDDVDMFFKSIAMSVKKFPPSLQAEAKYQVLLAVSSLQYGTCDPTLRSSCHCHFS